MEGGKEREKGKQKRGGEEKVNTYLINTDIYINRIFFQEMVVTFIFFKEVISTCCISSLCQVFCRHTGFLITIPPGSPKHRI